MTQQRRDSHSTEFGIWTRNQPEIDSGLGFVATNIDWLWCNYKTEQWMYIEEKRYGKYPSWQQVHLYRKADTAAQGDTNYSGFHLLVFEKTNPADGRILLDGRLIDRGELIAFQRFEAPTKWYQSWFPAPNVVGIDFTKIMGVVNLDTMER